MEKIKLVIIIELEELLAEKVSCDDFKNDSVFYNEFVIRDNSFDIDFSHFEHYLADQDIRGKDTKYSKMQNKELKKMISLLKEKDIQKDKIEQISFLTTSF